ncbi:MAG: ABC transporter ATP-binding protein [Deltaproteobacteria bacterium]|nr:ABC transporter ATP-binding protein [Deltaproteobacteria bacterium]
MSRTPILECTELSKTYGDLPVVKGVTLSVADGEFVSLVGKSGSGKTTLLSLLSGLESPSAGRVVLDGKVLTSAAEDDLALFRREKVGFVFQSFHLIPTLFAWENVALPLFPLRMGSLERYERAAGLLVQMGLGDRLEHLPSKLSGGEKQRVAIARALVNHPRILFADEPTGNLDSATGASIMELLRKLQAEERVTVLMITHDAALAEQADRMLRMRDGEVLQ